MTSISEPAVDHFKETFSRIRGAISTFMVGQQEIIDDVLIAICCGGHVLLEGVPGLGKTSLVNTIAQAIDVQFKRIQFTPDLLPSDVVGTQILMDRDGRRELEFQPGPVFCNLLLADEINRATPKTQAALLETMQEKRVTVANHTHTLALPFFVMATQNPIENDGTYPLPEAQLDRFFFQLHIGYPSLDEEAEIVRRTAGHKAAEPAILLDPAKVIELQEAAVEMPLPESVIQTILKLVHSTRPDSEHATAEVKNYVSFGAGPRASQCLARGARALALLRGKSSASPDEVRAVALPILRHRVIPNYNATGEGVTTDQIIAKLVAAI